jgi:hypothetical protein
MSDYGLVLPDHDLTAADFKELARRVGRAAFMPLFLRYYERVVTSEATIEEQRRGLVDIARWTGVEEEKKSDPNANLPVFQIIFGQAGTSAASIEAVEVIQPPTHEPLPTPDPRAPDALLDSAAELIPADMLKSFAHDLEEVARSAQPAGSRMKEIADAQPHAAPSAAAAHADPPAPVEPGRSADPPPEPVRSGPPDSGPRLAAHRAGIDYERPQGLQLAPAAPAETRDEPVSPTFTQALADLDSLLDI